MEVIYNPMVAKPLPYPKGLGGLGQQEELFFFSFFVDTTINYPKDDEEIGFLKDCPHPCAYPRCSALYCSFAHGYNNGLFVCIEFNALEFVGKRVCLFA